METGFPNLDETVVATVRYLETLERVTEEEVRAPSLLPGWSRAHVVAHLSLNADALANVLHGAQQGEVRSMYESQEQRDADIAARVFRPVEDLREDAAAAAGRWLQAANELHVANLDAPGRRTPGTETWPVRRVGMMRRTEVEVHHADVGLGYSPRDWPADFVEALMKRRHRELESKQVGLRWEATDTRSAWSTADEAPLVRGTAADIVWWLLGRSGGESLECSTGELPDLGRWA